MISYKTSRQEGRVPGVLLPSKSSTLLTFFLAQILSRALLRVSLCVRINCSADPETAIP